MLIRGLRLAPFVIVLAFALGTAGCAADARHPEVVRTDSAGIEIVTDAGVDRPLDWRFERVLALGGKESGPESFYRVGPTSVGADSAGGLYVLDRENHRVAVFDGQGRHLRTLGREGGGPGELEWPFNLSVAPDGTVSVFDVGKRALVRFGPDGEVLDQLRLDIDYFGPALRVVGSTVLYNGREYRADQPESHHLLMSWRDGEAGELARIAYPTPQRTRFASCGVTFPAAPVFLISLRWDAGPAGVAANRGADYVVDVFRDGEPARSIRRPIPPRAATEALARRQLEADPRTINACPIPADEYLRDVGFGPVVQAIGAIALAPDGTLWVRRGALAGEEPIIDVFAPDGAYAGTLPPGSPFPILFLPDGRIAAEGRDELDIERLVVYRIDRGGGEG